MAKTKVEWTDMTADQRKAFTAEGLAQAIEVIKLGKFPTCLRVSIEGTQYLAKPARVTDSGGVTYSIGPRPCTARRREARLNKFSFTLMSSDGRPGTANFDEEKFLSDDEESTPVVVATPVDSLA
jgi:hypothetical protein